MSPHTFLEDSAAGVALVYLEGRNVWAVIDSNGCLLAQAANPAHLADWWSDYCVQLGEMHERGEL